MPFSGSWSKGVGMKRTGRPPRSCAQRSCCLWFLTVLALGCGAAPEGGDDTTQLASNDAEELGGAGTEDGLAEAFQTFETRFSNGSESVLFTMGVGYHLGLSTERVTSAEGAVLNRQV